MWDGQGAAPPLDALLALCTPAAPGWMARTPGAPADELAARVLTLLDAGDALAVRTVLLERAAPAP